MNLLVALAEWLLGRSSIPGEIAPDPIHWAFGAKVPSLIAFGEYWRLVTASFLHGSWLHLFFNMLALLAVGRLVETFYGSARMLVIYVFASVAGLVASYHLNLAISLGASAGIMGLIGALVAHHAKYRAYLSERAARFLPGLIFLVALQFLFDLASPRTDFIAHLGGFCGGGATALLLESRISGPAQGEREWLPLPTALATALLLLAYGAVGMAMNLRADTALLQLGRQTSTDVRIAGLERLLARKPYFSEARLQVIGLLLARGDLKRAAEHHQEALRVGGASGLDGMIRQQLGAYYAAIAQRALRAKLWEEALVASRGLLSLDVTPEVTATAHNNIAWILADGLDRDLELAETHAREALRRMPDDPTVLDTLAWVWYKQGRYREAREVQARAVRLAEAEAPRQGRREELAELYYHLGAIEERLGRLDVARQQFRKALEAWPDYSAASEGLRRLAPQPPPLRRPPAPGQPAAETAGARSR